MEEALATAENGSLIKIEKLINVLRNPYVTQNNIDEYQEPAPSTNKNYQTFCGT